MDSPAVLRYIRQTFPGLDIVTGHGDVFIFYDPGKSLPHNQRQPFVTLVHSDAHDKASNLDREGVWRLNIGIGRSKYQELFGDPPPFPKDGGTIDTGHDFTQVDVVLPHPVYAAFGFVCILSPSDETFRQSVQPLLAEAYGQARAAYEKRGR